MEKLKIDEFYNYKFLSDVKWAPGGARAGFIVTQCDAKENKYLSSIWLYENGNIRRITGMDAETSFYWEDETHIIFPAVRSTSERKRIEKKEVFTSYYRIDVNGGEALRAFELPIKSGEIIALPGGKYCTVASIDVRHPDIHAASSEEKAKALKEDAEESDYEVLEQIPWWRNGGTYSYRKRSALFLCDIETGECKRLTDIGTNVKNTAVYNGKLYFTADDYSTDIIDNKSGVYEYDLEKDSVCCVFEPHHLQIRYFDAGSNGLILNSSISKEMNCWFRLLNPDTGELTVINEYPDAVGYSVGSDCRKGGGYSMRTCGDTIYFSTTKRTSSHLCAIDAEGIDSVVCGEEGSVDCFDVNEKGEILAVCMYGQRLQELYRLDGGEVKKVSCFNDDVLKDKYVAVPEKLTFISEGYDIDGWVLKPIDYDPNKTYPAVLDIHGGPKSIYGEIFYHEMQLWANEGYFVFFCNPVGSDGRGNHFARVLSGQYGKIDYKNIMDFTDAVLKKYPQIDKKRLAVTGGSYGGFMTNWIIGHTDRFACAATQRSIANWVTMEAISDIGARFTEEETRGNILTAPEKLWEQSPIRFANNFVTPTLIIHSDCDYRCPLPEGFQIYYALKKKGTDTRMVIFHGENHELSRSGKPKHRLRRLTEITDWIEKYTK